MTNGTINNHGIEIPTVSGTERLEGNNITTLGNGSYAIRITATVGVQINNTVF